jgi:hypothetical protein
LKTYFEIEICIEMAWGFFSEGKFLMTTIELVVRVLFSKIEFIYLNSSALKSTWRTDNIILIASPSGKSNNF